VVVSVHEETPRRGGQQTSSGREDIPDNWSLGAGSKKKEGWALLEKGRRRGEKRELGGVSEVRLIYWGAAPRITGDRQKRLWDARNCKS